MIDVLRNVKHLRFRSCLIKRLKEATRFFFFFQAEDGIRDATVTGAQTCALPIAVSFHLNLLHIARNFLFNFPWSLFWDIFPSLTYLQISSYCWGSITSACVEESLKL